MHDGQAAGQAGERPDQEMGGCGRSDDGGNDLSCGEENFDVVDNLGSK